MTIHLRVDAAQPSLETLEQAADILRHGGLVAFPTETVYGLGTVSGDPEAERRLAAVKERPDDKPFTHLLATESEIFDLVEEVPPKALELIERYWPGPLTVVLRRRPDRDETIGIRLPGSDIARMLVGLTGRPLLAPSANPAGAPPATNADEVKAYFDGRIDAIIDGGPVALRESSTVVRVEGDRYEILRSGFITPEMIQQLLSGRMVLFVCTGNTCRSPMAAALFRKRLAAKVGRAEDELEECGYRILSAGTFAFYGGPASDHAMTVMSEHGCDLQHHLSRPVTRELLLRADRVFTLTAGHQHTLLQLGADIEGLESRVRTLADEDITDPIGQGIDEYRHCAREIDAALHTILETF